MTDSHFYVDDRKSNTQLYRIVQVGFQNDSLIMQTIFMDLAIGEVYEASADLSKSFKIDCASKIIMRDGLVVISCDKKHKLWILMITDE